MTKDHHLGEPLAQKVEHRPFKARALGSSPRRLTNLSIRNGCPHRLAWPRTRPFQGRNTGSNPVGDTRVLYECLAEGSRLLQRRISGSISAFQTLAGRLMM